MMDMAGTIGGHSINSKHSAVTIFNWTLLKNILTKDNYHHRIVKIKIEFIC